MSLADRGYDANLIEKRARQQGAWANIVASKSVHKLLFGLIMLISVPPSRPTVHVLRRMLLVQTECSIFQRIHYDLGAPMKYPPHHGAEQNLASATQRNQDDRRRGLRGQ
jgi:hypothetical protein